MSCFGKKYYDADVGLWTTCDPAKEFWSAYSYTSGNPIAFIDKLGLTEIYFMLGGTWSAKDQKYWIEFKQFQKELMPLHDAYEAKHHDAEFKILNKESFLAALNDPEVMFVYILSHGAENEAALKSMTKGEFITPMDIPKGTGQPVIRAAACYQGTYEPD